MRRPILSLLALATLAFFLPAQGRKPAPQAGHGSRPPTQTSQPAPAPQTALLGVVVNVDAETRTFTLDVTRQPKGEHVITVTDATRFLGRKSFEDLKEGVKVRVVVKSGTNQEEAVRIAFPQIKVTPMVPPADKSAGPARP